MGNTTKVHLKALQVLLNVEFALQQKRRVVKCGLEERQHLRRFGYLKVTAELTSTKIRNGSIMKLPVFIPTRSTSSTILARVTLELMFRPEAKHI